ncbi:hypothetical protein ACTQV2_01015 [Bifidobacterium thermophilum]|uniref:hypothetical protein n=1 Tax=Bifidobacterium thermophilum TaxID=33905 RepID=UPI003F8E3AE6
MNADIDTAIARLRDLDPEWFARNGEKNIRYALNVLAENPGILESDIMHVTPVDVDFLADWY